jgi:Secretion system C-terminal sorting domain
MKKNILSGFLLAGVLLSGASLYAQPGNTGYAVTDSLKDGVKWNCLRTVDLRTGAYSGTLLRILSANDLLSPPPNVLPNNGIAAIALDKKNKRLYYTPMLTDRLSYIDLRTMQTVVVTNSFTSLMPKAADQSNIITRMVIGDDDFGYALTNDGNRLIRFSTKNNPAITNLGSLVDAPGNNGVSIHNGCSSYGGDIVLDEEGNLYLITIRNLVFKINTRTRVAKYRGSVTGLPPTFTTSGVAVNETEKKLVIASSTDTTGVYKVNINSLSAVKLSSSLTWRTSDLASSNILEDEDDSYPGLITRQTQVANDSILLYPNPVTNGVFNIQFINVNSRKYSINIMDAKGQIILQQEAEGVGKINQVQVNMPALTAKGIFIVRVADQDNKIVFSGKIILQ